MVKITLCKLNSMKDKDIEIYKLWVEERRSIVNLSWQIFGIASATLFAAPLIILREASFPIKSVQALTLGVAGLIITVCIFGILFNYRRRENTLEKCIKTKEEKLRIYGFRDIEKRVSEVAWPHECFPEFTKKLNENRWFMGIVFFILATMYFILILANLKATAGFFNNIIAYFAIL